MGENESIIENTHFTREECEIVKNAYMKSHQNYRLECRKTNNKLKKYEICGIKSEKEFCLKTGINDYDYNEEIINNTFNDCEVNSDLTYTCNETTYGLYNKQYKYHNESVSSLVGVSSTSTPVTMCHALRGNFDYNPVDLVACVSFSNP